ncbi:MAG: ABC transporter ATP-binding protein [Propionibacteriaceae bacterium]|nr:ABC transporter ATP-binding protein [Propionibacteriaceae bacterium]
MNIIEVDNLSKRYDRFQLVDISLSLPLGSILGVMGATGSGKTTLLTSMLHLVRPDTGTVGIWGRDVRHHHQELKQKIGFVATGAPPYSSRTPEQITSMTRRFYPNWDHLSYLSAVESLEISEKVKLSRGSRIQQVKYALAAAVGHHSELLVLDDPTRGMGDQDKKDIMELLAKLTRSTNLSLVFTTRDASQVEAYADYGLYLREGRMVVYGLVDDVRRSFLLVRGSRPQLTKALEDRLMGIRVTGSGFTGMIWAYDQYLARGCELKTPRLDQVMVYTERAPSHPKRAQEEVNKA